MADNAAPIFLLTRPRAQSERFAGQMRDVLGAGIDIRIHPLQEIAPLDGTVDLSGITALAFTSENGVRVFAEQNPRRDLPAYCVGDRTAGTARALGFEAFSASGAVDDLADLIVAAKPTGPILHLHGTFKAGDLVAALRDKGVSAQTCVIYDQAACPVGDDFQTLLREAARIIVPVFSPRNAVLLSGALAQAEGAQIVPIAISQTTCDALVPELAAVCEVAPRPSGADMLQLLLRHISL